MLLFRSISVIILLLIPIKNIVGATEENTISDDVYSNTSSGSGHNDTDVFDANDKSHDSKSDAYVQHKFDSLVSNEVINIMMDVYLLAVVLIRDLQNISIIGHNNPTVNCDNAGGIHFERCHNCTITGITLENCGTTNDSKPAIQLYDSSDITIENCTFKHSVTQALVISEVLGNVRIYSCKFLFNNKFEGHGVTIYYLSKIQHRSKFQLNISSCIFTHNAMIGKSVVYISSSLSEFREQIFFTNFVFVNNRAIPLYISHQKVFASGKILFKGNTANESGGIFITNHSNVIFHKSDAKFNKNKALGNGGAFHIEDNSDVSFSGDSTFTINDNNATYGGALYIVNNSNFTCEGNSTVTINSNRATVYGGALSVFNNSGVMFEGNSIITINSNRATYGGALHIVNHSHVTFDGHSVVKFNNNQGTYCGGALGIFNSSGVMVKGNAELTINNNDGTNSGGAFIAFNNSGIIFEGDSIIQINDNKARDGGAIHIEKDSDIIFEKNTVVTINNNKARNAGGAVFASINCSATFEESSMIKINNNKARNGGAILIARDSDVTFKDNAKQTIDNNQARDGGAFCIFNNSVATFAGNCTTIITNNKQVHRGGAFAVYTDSGVTFEGNCTVKINHNQAFYGGAFQAESNSDVAFKGSSVVTINNNEAMEDGGAILTWTNSGITFEQTSTVIINNNKANNYGGAIRLLNYCDLTVKNDALVKFYNNSANANGGALHAGDSCNITVKENSTTVFSSNVASGDGGAVYTNINSIVTFKDFSSVEFNDNKASHGGALYFRQNSGIVFEEDTFVKLHNNIATIGGGALYTWDNCRVIIKGNSTVAFDNNKALGGDGGAVYINVNNIITFQENATVKLKNNAGIYSGGGIYSNSDIKFEDNCTVTFIHNEASQGGAVFAMFYIIFKDNSTIKFDDNRARTLGGALCISNLTFSGNTAVTFNNNNAILNGGALYSSNSSVAMEQNSTVSFTNNGAENGGAVFISASTLLVSEYSSVTLNNNTAENDGGAIYFNDQVNAVLKNSCTVTLSSNTADNHGGAVYSRITQNAKYFNISEINHSENVARTAGNLLYIDVAKSCNESCFTEEIAGINLSGKEIATSPIKLMFYYPARCINNNSIACKQYYIDNIMLGQEITINACLLDYYNNPTEVTQFKIIGENNQDYFIPGSEYASISCNHKIEGIGIIGSKPVSSLPLNYSVFFTSDATATHKSVRKNIYVNLVIGLSPCHPGFQYHNKSQKCECYNTSGVVYCSGSTSAIKRGYWFGNVNGIPTVTFCPINYCNFTCCKMTNGFYELSPVRVNQCRTHRSGTACGNCEEGYTLSFDSAECINVNRCTTGEKVLIITLTVIYWFVVIIATFVIMYYQVGIGYLYAVTYYYSVVDILLSQHTDISNGLYIMVNIMSSIAKITPQFLGHLCLLENMSGIDQQFIHYIHPLAISMILMIICWLARKFKRLSTFISRGIIRVICFLLLLSYTSMATTSLLLMRLLTFVNVDNFYTYLSPNIKYFHGRHLAYGIIAIIFSLLIVIGLPLLLLLEPFLNRKVNFIKIKPLLDQFQGCYKDKYRWFAAYYMICRLIIISVIIANLSEAFISRYLLITITTIMALIHLLMRPYADNILNMFDGAVLQLLILVTVLPLFEYFDTFDSSLVIGIAFILVIFPLVQFIVMKVFTSKQTHKAITKKIIKQFSSQDFTHQKLSVNRTVTNFTDLIIDDNMRRNAVICEM